MIRRRRPADEGFTLIEVVVALGVFAVVSLATVSILITALRTVRENEDRVLAANIARSELEQARIAGAAAVPLGLSERQVSEFTVRMSTNWVGVNQQVSACDAISPGQDFLRVSVEVSGRTLAAPQRIDGVIPGVDPQEATGAMTVFVGNAYADPLSDVTITGTDTFHAGNNFQVVTGSDGCVFLPNLEPSGSLQVLVQSQINGVSLIPRTPEADRQQVQINLDEVSRVSFELALPAGVRFESLDASYPVPQGIDVSWKQLTTGSITKTTPLATPIDGLWPSTSGFEAWLGTCTDADPRAYGGSPTSFDLTGGTTVTVPVEGAKVRARGLAPEGSLSITYAGDDPECAGLTLDGGLADETGRVDVLLPYGNWVFESEDEVQTLEQPLEPSPDRVLVTFTLNEPEPTESPSPTPTVTP